MLAEIILAAALGVFGLPQKQLGDPTPKPPPNPTDRLTRQVATGPVQELDKHALVIARSGAPLKIEVPEHTPIVYAGRYVPLQILAPGLVVRVSYDAVQGPPRANWIEVVTRRKP